MVTSAAGEVVPPWVEKYRPGKLSNLISHDEIIATINKFTDENQLPHLLFYGPPGTGKTSTILACAKQLYSPGQFKSMVLELNASDDRGINIVREQILNFASTRTIFNDKFKLIILDEADAMTNDAQNALRRIIEKYTENVRFCIICNYLSKIIPALQPRCTRFRFAPVLPEQIMPRLKHIIEAEQLKVDEDGLKAIIQLSRGDMRKVLNILQSTWIAFKEINEENVYLCVGHPLKSDIEYIINCLLSVKDFEACHDEIAKTKLNRGVALEGIITELHLVVMRIGFPPRVLNQLLIKLAKIRN